MLSLVQWSQLCNWLFDINIMNASFCCQNIVQSLNHSCIYCPIDLHSNLPDSHGQDYAASHVVKSPNLSAVRVTCLRPQSLYSTIGLKSRTSNASNLELLMPSPGLFSLPHGCLLMLTIFLLKNRQFSIDWVTNRLGQSLT